MSGGIVFALLPDDGVQPQRIDATICAAASQIAVSESRLDRRSASALGFEAGSRSAYVIARL